MMNRYEKIKEFILKKQLEELPVNLYYHGVHHVLDVLYVAEQLSEMEHLSPQETELIRVAVLFHDTGYIYGRLRHEENSCAVATSTLPGFGYSEDEINMICRLILATRTPQTPADHLEEIICDADMDYLGRDDFFIISDNLRKELSADNMIMTEEEWNRMQLTFFQGHHYFTESAKRMRQEKKLENMALIRKEISKI